MRTRNWISNLLLAALFAVVGQTAAAQMGSAYDALPPALRAAIESGNANAVGQAIATLSGGNPDTAAALGESLARAADELSATDPNAAATIQAAVAISGSSALQSGFVSGVAQVGNNRASQGQAQTVNITPTGNPSNRVAGRNSNGGGGGGSQVQDLTNSIRQIGQAAGVNVDENASPEAIIRDVVPVIVVEVTPSVASPI